MIHSWARLNKPDINHSDNHIEMYRVFICLSICHHQHHITTCEYLCMCVCVIPEFIYIRMWNRQFSGEKKNTKTFHYNFIRYHSSSSRIHWDYTYMKFARNKWAWLLVFISTLLYNVSIWLNENWVILLRNHFF